MPLSSGARLGPYVIDALIGAGGMGEVYRAQDPRLARAVAIKVLPSSFARDEGRLQRFEQEARAVAALSHPNVLAIHDVGTGDDPYVVTELLEGETLRSALERGPLPLNQAITVALQLAAGLAAAHERGIVHRDLKPDNIFLTCDGLVKILDFGLAKAERPATADVDITRIDVSTPGLVIGTVGYMAPEQLRGEPADPRADIFAAGATIYEMISGVRAFRGDSPADTIGAVLKDQPPDLALRSGTPPSLARLVRRCLEKRPEDRFQSVRDLRLALESMTGVQNVSSAGAKESSSVAVLPFTNVSNDIENQYFSDGLAEELINALTRLPGLRVASRTSSFACHNRTMDVRQIGADLQVAAVLEGSVRRSGNRLRVTAQLTSASDGYHLWSERYDRQMADVFDIQDEIVESIVKALAPTLLGSMRGAVKRPTENLQAYELYLKGRHYWHLRSPNTMQAAMRCFEQVIEIDPDYALAHAGLSDCYSICRIYGWLTHAQARGPAQHAAARALELDPSLAEVHCSQALYTFYFERAWREAELPLRRALEIDPRSVIARGYLGLVLSCAGRYDEAVHDSEATWQLDPLSAFAHYLASAGLALAYRFERSAQIARRALELQPDSLMVMWPLAIALEGMHQRDEAVRVMERAVMLSRSPIIVGQLGLAYGRAGREDEARRLLGELDERARRGEYIGPSARLAIHAGLGDVPAMRESLAACLEDMTPILTLKGTAGILLESYRSDPEIDRLLRVAEDARDRTRLLH